MGPFDPKTHRPQHGTVGRMAMNCKPVPTLDERINDIRMRTAEIVNNDIIPNENRLWAERREGESFHERTEILELRAEIKEKVKTVRRPALSAKRVRNKAPMKRPANRLAMKNAKPLTSKKPFVVGVNILSANRPGAM